MSATKVGVGGLSATIAIALVLAFSNLTSPVSAQDLLPDSICVPDVLGEIRVDAETRPGRRLLRLSNSTPNIGRGPLEIRGGAVLSDTRRNVVQRVYRADGSSWDRPAGTSTYHADHQHVHFDDWVIYRLRTVTQAGGLGDAVAEGLKTSFCLVDTYVYDRDSPYLETDGAYGGCASEVQGISPGWTDVYDRDLPDQWVDITDVSDGLYWLEAQVDPDDKILEDNEGNNLCRVQAT